MKNHDRIRCLKCGYYVSRKNEDIGLCTSCQPQTAKKVWHPDLAIHEDASVAVAIKWYMENRNVCFATAEQLVLPEKFKDFDRCAGNASEPEGIIKTMLTEYGEYKT